MKKLYTLFLLASIGAAAQGSLCTDPIVIGSLPYSTTDNTANYGDNYDPQTVSSPFCSLTTYGNQYHSGNDVIYSYTPSASGTIKVQIPSALAWTGMFIYNNCADIGVNYAACATGPSAGARTIDNFPVTAGQTYYIYISSWEAPQTVAYTLNVTSLSLGLDAAPDAAQVTLFPNPVHDHLVIGGDVAFDRAVIYNIQGQRLEAKLDGNRIQTGHLQSGVYTVELTTAEGGQVLKKFVKAGQ